METEKPCSKCGNRIFASFYIYYGGETHRQLEWFSGKPMKKKVLGFEVDNPDLDGKVTFKVKTYRCMECGFLDSYAV